ncbi:site-specific integrase [Streptomyces sp. ME02-7008A-1]|uniref:tyrosine-type recombinase/integrase n=1 Tax=Streptomyces TaxID=1883 RepID=UPI000AAC8F86|nr:MULTISPECIES: site-specific integrase [Streptomyces]MDX3186603.1 site-specific integrase [Streptomyces sp. ME02-7008A-1]MDX3307375.1 site-specific integrase [Streptomyces sp. ME02-7008A]
MSVTSLALRPEAVPDCERTQALIDALDPEFLKLISWDWELGILVYPREHPVIGMPECSVKGCDKGWERRGPFCSGCRIRWRASELSVEEFIGTQDRFNVVHVRQALCRFPDCKRPWRSPTAGLCQNHHYQRLHKLKIPLEAFLAHPLPRPYPGHGMCDVAACHRQRVSPGSEYCDAHRQKLTKDKNTGAFDGDEELWRLTAPPVHMSQEVSMRGLPRRVVAELLYCVQQRTANGVRTYGYWLRAICDKLRALRCERLDDLGDPEEAGLKDHPISLVKTMRRTLYRFGATAEDEALRDVWDLAVFGYGGTADFTDIRQDVLREAVKVWAADDLPRRRGNAAGRRVQRQIEAMVELSKSLHLQREDGGLVVSLLDRRDIVAFCNRLAFKTENGKLSAHQRLDIARTVRKILNRWRTLGLTAKGELLDGLRADFVLGPEDMPDEPEDTEAGKDLPDEVMQQLCDNLNLLEEMSGPEVRVCTELLIDTGRRPDEACRLPLDCLERDPDGSPVLIYDNHKAHRLGRRLPIAKATAAVIVAQQKRVRERFPDTPSSELKLLPSPVANPWGTKPISGIWDQHRNWVRALPDFLVPIEVEEDGNLVTRLLPFDKKKVFPYAYRHSFAQRHADKGVAPEVLKELMDHRQLQTSQAYYRIGQDRRREAIDRVTVMQFDRHGNRVWRKVQGLLDSEHVRRGIGEVATAYGVCKEPSNVAAGGQSCALRFRCLGCEHFSTDISYLPDLEAYLSDLLRSREKLMSAFEADDWARSEAMPSEEEIGRVRRLISRVKADLDDLTEEERTQVEQAVSVVRRGRSVMLGMPRVGQPLPDVRPRRAA